MDDYVETLIMVAEDCPVAAAVVPTPRGSKPTVASIQYALLAARPYQLTQGDVLLATWLTQQGETDISAERLDAIAPTISARTAPACAPRRCRSSTAGAFAMTRRAGSPSVRWNPLSIRR